MAKSKYARKSNGEIRGINTTNLNLEKPLGNENYNINIFNSNMDKIDFAINDLKSNIQNIELVDTKVKLTDPNNLFKLGENANINQALMILANKTNKIDVDLNGQRLKAIDIHNRMDKII